jgi:hypothetical protein
MLDNDHAVLLFSNITLAIIFDKNWLGRVVVNWKAYRIQSFY